MENGLLFLIKGYIETVRGINLLNDFIKIKLFIL